MFNPSRDEVRRFFCEVWRKRQAGEVISPLESIALHWIDQHPEYHALLGDPQGAIAAEFSIENGHTNPFLHLSMHLAIAEQVSVDQPPGIAAAFARLAAFQSKLILSRLGAWPAFSAAWISATVLLMMGPTSPP